MKYSELLIPTLREAPSDAEVISHKLMMRAGYVRKLATGIYTYLTLCLRVMRKIENIVRDEMQKAGSHEVLLPLVMPAELWQESGRWEQYGKELLRFRDRHNREFCLGPTHEEAITDLFRHEIKSYRDLPKNAFQIQTKFRDEIRPRFGLMRGREFIMKDGYSFDRDVKGAHKTYEAMYQAYKNIFKRCGLQFRPVEATTGNIGGTRSHEFQVLAQSGEDQILSCSKCEYAANIEKAEVKAPDRLQTTDQRLQTKGRFEKVHTPNLRTAEEVGPLVKLTPKQMTKTLLFDTDQGPIIGMVRADRQLMEEKLKNVAGVAWCHLAVEETVRQVTSAPAGFAGPIGLNIPVYVDYELLKMEDFLVGANEKDYHFIKVNLGDFKITKFADLRSAEAGDLCARCDGTYELHRGIEVGHVFYLGTKYSQSMKATYLDEAGKEQFIEMGCYGIGIGRTTAAAIEQNHDERGMIWPLPIAPFHIEVIPLGNDEAVLGAAQKMYHDLLTAKIEVLYDDRDARPGVKMADADLIGIPYQLIIGAKGLAEGKVELKERRTGNVMKIEVAQVLPTLAQKLAN